MLKMYGQVEHETCNFNKDQLEHLDIWSKIVPDNGIVVQFYILYSFRKEIQNNNLCFSVLVEKNVLELDIYLPEINLAFEYQVYRQWCSIEFGWG